MITGKELRIISLLTLDTVFFLLEITIGYMSHSLALIADSFHMLNDIISLLVALWAVDVAKNRGPDAKYTYGWKRAEILGALINAVFLIALCFSIMIEALQRLIEPQEIQNPRLVLYVGIAGLISNVVGLFLFHDHGSDSLHSHSHGSVESGNNDLDIESNATHSHSHASLPNDNLAIDEDAISSPGPSGQIGEVLPQSVVNRLSNESRPLLNHDDHDHSHESKKPGHRSLNMHGVFLHVLGDALGNIGVIAAALFIWKTEYSWRYYSDPIVSLIITVIIFSSALPLSRRASRILLQATPSTISADQIQREILAVPGVIAVHDFHVWNLTESIYIASIHVQIDCAPDKFMSSAKLIRKIFHQHGIHSATVQPEFVSGDVNEDIRRRFSIIAGGSPSSSQEAFDSHGNTEHGRKKRSPTAYGATTASSNCIVDDAVNCNTSNCL
ncbi:AVN_HP_G0125450.mRNA.1.CDS.1 [Saccharomyces cerevisiae]|nr:AVN_HP_G0035690.mRNA.1.CDS.1 [Saccharomyces cerevisiae]CAI5069134.1 AVN_HP_G0001660.mRNA.1.CDS.1 [Saccharomyces cerevisiae]CAI5185539.1 AVN_HP_G0125450.mRNA.1.CDS.1 [Saccharomyces cerevisiae]CAI6861784.1 AVN_HP_G0035690.mRNA.1.CDS.1 [Saccharomyces cerevisiae]CAI6963725.1 AVN_HP_G0001660.mRNA.1.CDS.1 [Saccharomyces cerevisiae]